MKSNPSSLLFLPVAAGLFALAQASTCFGAEDVPQRPRFDRYNAMLNKSPFAVATAVQAPAATPSFAKDLYIANAARTPEGDLVTVQSAVDRNLKEYLTSKGPNEHGYAIASMEWSDKPGQTKVTITKDGQSAPVGFNQALISQAPSGGNPQPSGGAVPGQPSVPIPAYVPPKLPNAAGVPTPPPHTRGLIQRNPSAAAARPNPEGPSDQ